MKTQKTIWEIVCVSHINTRITEEIWLISLFSSLVVNWVEQVLERYRSRQGSTRFHWTLAYHRFSKEHAWSNFRNADSLQRKYQTKKKCLSEYISRHNDQACNASVEERAQQTLDFLSKPRGVELLSKPEASDKDQIVYNPLVYGKISLIYPESTSGGQSSEVPGDNTNQSAETTVDATGQLQGAKGIEGHNQESSEGGGYLEEEEQEAGEAAADDEGDEEDDDDEEDEQDEDWVGR